VAGGAVIHKLAPPRYAGPLRSLMNNCETDISGLGREAKRNRPARRPNKIDSEVTIF
jgi:hypothetical protein